MAFSPATDGEMGTRAGALALPLLAESRERGEEGGFAAAVTTRWLGECPAGPLALGPEAAPVLRALADGWATTAIHALAKRPRTTAELAIAIGASRAEAAADAIRAMQEVGLVEPAPGPGGKAYLGTTTWLRRGIGPLAAAARQECAEAPAGAAPIDPLDVEAAFRLGLPLIGGLDRDVWHLCRLIVTMPQRDVGLAGVTLFLEDGEIAEIGSDLSVICNTWASGPPRAWIETLIDPEHRKLSLNDPLCVLQDVLSALHEILFAEARPALGA